MRSDIVHSMFRSISENNYKRCRFGITDIIYRASSTISGNSGITLLRTDIYGDVIINASAIEECEYKQKFTVNNYGMEKFYLCEFKDTYKTKIIVGGGLVLLKDNANNLNYELFMCLCSIDGVNVILANMSMLLKMNSTRSKILKSAINTNIGVDIGTKIYGIVKRTRCAKKPEVHDVIKSILKKMDKSQKNKFVENMIIEGGISFKDTALSSYRCFDEHIMKILKDKSLYMFNKT